FNKFTLLHAVDLASNRVFSAFAAEQDNVIYPELSPAELEEVAPGETLQPMLIEARERLGVPWLPAEILLTATLRDQVSNRRKVTLAAPASKYQDPAVKEFLEQKKAKQAPPRPYPEPGDPFPAYVPVDGSPETPAEPGIALAA